MKTSYSTAIALAISTLIAGHALAADADMGKTREQVQAELVQARATGDITAPDQLSIDYTGRTGAKMNEIFPARYVAVAPVSTKTRADVAAEMKEAKRTGNVAAPTLTSLDYAGYGTAKMNEVFPGRYPAVAAAPTKTRAEVRAELAEAQRTGDLQADNLLSLVVTGVPGNKLNVLYPSHYPVKSRTVSTGNVVAAAY
ncbi:MAG: hypothetical protein CFE44_23000 [Burkholderiales bacterium PBB4]|nr:MAG: hypothetical protein CFE44_23000 [Burkholderiales bacterium PBB4]